MTEDDTQIDATVAKCRQALQNQTRAIDELVLHCAAVRQQMEVLKGLAAAHDGETPQAARQRANDFAARMEGISSLISGVRVAGAGVFDHDAEALQMYQDMMTAWAALFEHVNGGPDEAERRPRA